MKWKILLFLFIMLPIAYAATIEGSVYDLSLNLQPDIIIKVNSIPQQQLIAKEGLYTLTLNKGVYVITAEYYEDHILQSKAEEEITVNEEGTYRLDLILLDVLDEGLYEDADFDVNTDDGTSNPFLWVMILVVAAALILPYPIYRYFKARKADAEEEISDVVTDDLEKLLKIVKDEGGRTTQKLIRKRLGLSEAKISLMVSELEHKNLVIKIKKGRGNVIALKVSSETQAGRLS